MIVKPPRRCRHAGAIALIAACLATTPALLAQSPAPPAAPAHGAAFPVATPESQGLSAEALSELADIVRGYIERDLALGGELLVIKNRRTVLHDTFGLVDREPDRPWAPDTICNIRSMTKPLTGAAIQILIDRGKLAPSDTVATYIPGFDTDEARAITIEQLLSHRGGLPLSILERVDEYESLIAQADSVGARGPEFEPGSKFWYSDAGSDVLGAVVEVASGMPLDAFWQRELFAPLGMTDTFVPADPDDPRFDRIAPLYAGAAHAWMRFWTPDDGEPFYPFAWGSQTAYSTPRDYAKFLAMWMDQGMVGGARLLSKDAITRTLTPTSEMATLGSDAPYPCGFDGLDVFYGQMAMLYLPEGASAGAEPVIIGHGGSDGTMAWAWPQLDLMVLYFTQSRGGVSVLRLEPEIDRLLIHPGREVVEAPIPEQYRPYLGTYIANFAAFRDESFEVLVQDGKLALDIPSQMIFELLEPDENGHWRFAISEAVAISFERDEQGEVHLMKLHQGGMTFDVPRAGTKLAEAMSRPPTVDDPEAVRAFVGRYHDPQVDRVLDVYLEGDVFTLRAPPGVIFHLVATDEPHRWQVKQVPMVYLVFDEDESGAIVSMTREIGGEKLVMPRMTEEETDDAGADEP